jgi:hypothetical protein
MLNILLMKVTGPPGDNIPHHLGFVIPEVAPHASP